MAENSGEKINPKTTPLTFFIPLPTAIGWIITNSLKNHFLLELENFFGKIMISIFTWKIENTKIPIEKFWGASVGWKFDSLQLCFYEFFLGPLCFYVKLKNVISDNSNSILVGVGEEGPMGFKKFFLISLVFFSNYLI